MSRVVGKKLRETRNQKNLTIEQVVAATHIRSRFIEAMETGNFDALPSPLQVKGFLRSYASFLGLDSEPLIEALSQDPWSALATLQQDQDQPEEESPAQAEPAPTQPTLTAPESVDSQTNFTQIGATLRNQREILGLSLNDIENHTKIKQRYLKAIEAGNIEALPSPVQGRGMLKNFASFLGLDAEALLLQFAQGLQNRRTEIQSQTTEVSGPRPTRREGRRFPMDILLGVILAISLVIFIIWGALQVSALQTGGEIEPTAPSIADVLLPSATPSGIPTATATPALILNAENGVANNPEVAPEEVDDNNQQIIYVSEDFDRPIQVQIVVRQRAWVQVTVDEKEEFSGRVLPGSAYAFAGEDYVEIQTGNGAGLQVLYNDFDLGTLGTYGEVINFVITASGVQTPTPTLTPTFTPTPENTPTPLPTLAP